MAQSNAFGLIHNVLSDEEIAQLPPVRQQLEQLAKDLHEKTQKQEKQEVDVRVEWSEDDGCWGISVCDEVILVEAESPEEAYENALEDIDLAITRYAFTH